MSRQESMSMRQGLQQFFTDLKTSYHDTGREVLLFERRLKDFEADKPKQVLSSDARAVLEMLFEEKADQEAFLRSVVNAELRESFLDSDERFDAIFDGVIDLLRENTFNPDEFIFMLSSYFVTPPDQDILNKMVSVIAPDSGHGTSGSDTSEDSLEIGDREDSLIVPEVAPEEAVPVTTTSEWGPEEERMKGIVANLHIALVQYKIDHKVIQNPVFRFLRNLFKSKNKKYISQQHYTRVNNYIDHCDTFLFKEDATLEEKIQSLELLKSTFGEGLSDADIDIDAFETEQKARLQSQKADVPEAEQKVGLQLQKADAPQLDFSALLRLFDEAQRKAILSADQVIFRRNNSVLGTVDMGTGSKVESLIIDLDRLALPALTARPALPEEALMLTTGMFLPEFPVEAFIRGLQSRAASAALNTNARFVEAASQQAQPQPKVKHVHFKNHNETQQLQVQELEIFPYSRYGKQLSMLKNCLADYLDCQKQGESADGSWHLFKTKDRKYSVTPEQEKVVKIITALIEAYCNDDVSLIDCETILNLVSDMCAEYCTTHKKGLLYRQLSEFLEQHPQAPQEQQFARLSLYSTVVLTNALKAQGIRKHKIRDVYDQIATRFVLSGKHLSAAVEALEQQLNNPARVEAESKAGDARNIAYRAYYSAKLQLNAYQDARYAKNVSEQYAACVERDMARQKLLSKKSTSHARKKYIQKHKQKIQLEDQELASVTAAYKLLSESYYPSALLDEEGTEAKLKAACVEAKADYQSKNAAYEEVVAHRAKISAYIDSVATGTSKKEVKPDPKEQPVVSAATKRHDRLAPVKQVVVSKTSKMLLDAQDFLQGVRDKMKQRRTTKQHSRLSFSGLFGHKAAVEKPMSAEEISVNALYALVATINIQKGSEHNPREKVAFLKTVLFNYRYLLIDGKQVLDSKLLAYLKSDSIWEALELEIGGSSSLLPDVPKKYVKQTWCSIMQAAGIEPSQWPEAVTVYLLTCNEVEEYVETPAEEAATQEPTFTT